MNFHVVVGKALKQGKIDAGNVPNKKRWSAMERAWETIYGTFPGFPKDMNQTLTIYREMSVTYPDRMAQEIVDGSRNPGQYWAFDDAGAGTYMQGGSEERATSNVRMEAEVPLKDIDPAETVIQNFMNPDEYEAGLLTLDNLKLTKVEWLEQIDIEDDYIGGYVAEPRDVWHEVKKNGSRKGTKKRAAAAHVNKAEPVIKIGSEMELWHESGNAIERRYDIYIDGKMVGNVHADFPLNKKTPVTINQIGINKATLRGRGYGTILLKRVLADVDAAGLECKLIAAGAGGLHSTAEEKEAYAMRNVRLYQRHGFEITGRNKEWSGYDMYRKKTNKKKQSKDHDKTKGKTKSVAN